MTMSGDVAAPSDIAPPPDWAMVQQDILCPLCDYNLRGLVEPRCPECGHRFDWMAIRKAEKLHPFLFEHHPEKNIKSLTRTYLASLRPSSFWKKILPTHEPVLRRLMLYWLILLMPTLLASAAALARICMHERSTVLALRATDLRSINQYSPADYRQELIAKYGSVEKFVDQWYAMPSLFSVMRTNRQAAYIVMPVVGSVILWPWLTFATLLLFRKSLLQTRIKPGHVMRCVLYSGGAMMVFPPLIVAFAAWAPMFLSSRMSLVLPQVTHATLVGVWLLLMLGLGIGYWRYLRFPHSIATVLAAQTVVGLTMFNVYLKFLGN